MDKLSLSFTENMKGFLSIDQPVNPSLATHDRYVDFEEAYEEGRKNGTRCDTTLTIQIDDIEAFADNQKIAGNVIGLVDCPMLGGECKIIEGSFDLLVDAVPCIPSHRDIRYRLIIESPKGEVRTFCGTKFVDRVGPIFLWRDTTKLFTKVFEGRIAQGCEADAKIVAFGVLYISLIDLLRTMTTFRSNRSDWRSEFRAKWLYLRTFCRRLLQVYTG